jgi:putative transposase
MYDRAHNGASFRLLNVIDESTLEALLIRVQRRLNHKDVLASLSWLFLFRGIPAHIRSDNGHEFKPPRCETGWPESRFAPC